MIGARQRIGHMTVVGHPTNLDVWSVTIHCLCYSLPITTLALGHVGLLVIIIIYVHLHHSYWKKTLTYWCSVSSVITKGEAKMFVVNVTTIMIFICRPIYHSNACETLSEFKTTSKTETGLKGLPQPQFKYYI